MFLPVVEAQLRLCVEIEELARWLGHDFSTGGPAGLERENFMRVAWGAVHLAVREPETVLIALEIGFLLTLMDDEERLARAFPYTDVSKAFLERERASRAVFDDVDGRLTPTAAIDLERN